MAVTISSSYTQRSNFWTAWKAARFTKVGVHQHDDDGTVYTIWFYDGPEVHTCTIWKGTVPDSVVPVYSQAQNDSDKTDFETNYLSFSNSTTKTTTFSDPRVIHILGNLTATSASEVLVSAAAHVEQASQAQRSIVSTSAYDDNPSGSGAKIVRLVYLDSNYNQFTEDLQMNGTAAVNTVGTTIRFVQSLKVISGTAAAGTISLKTAINGGGTNICQITSATDQAFLCHHYIPAGRRCFLLGWGAVVTDDASMRLKGQSLIDGNRVDVIVDLDNLTGITAGARLDFYRDYWGGMELSEKTLIRITAAPGQATSTTVRAFLDLWEDKS